MPLSRLIAGYLIAPFAPVAAVTIITETTSIMSVNLAIAYCSALVIGAPLYFFLNRFGSLTVNNFNIFILIGFICECAPFFLYYCYLSLFSSDVGSVLVNFGYILFYGCLGALGGVIFWCVMSAPTKIV